MSFQFTLRQRNKGNRGALRTSIVLVPVGILFAIIALFSATNKVHADILIVGDADANLYKIDGSTLTMISNGPFNWGQPQNVSAITALGRQSDGTIVAGTQAGLVGRVDGNSLGQLNGDGQYTFGGGAAGVVGLSINASDDIFVALSNAHAGVLNGTTLGTNTSDGAYKFGASDPAPPFTAFTSQLGKAFPGTGGGFIGGLNDATLAGLGGNGAFKFGKPDPAVPITAMAINSAGNIIAGTEARYVGVVDSTTFGGLAGNGAYHFGGPETGAITAIATDGLGSAFVGLETGHVGKLDDTTLAQLAANGPYRYGVTDPAVSPISFIVVTSDGNPVIGTTTGWIALLDKNTLNEIASVQLNLAGNALTSALIYVPEPGSAVLVGLGGVALLARSRRRRNNRAQ